MTPPVLPGAARHVLGLLRAPAPFASEEAALLPGRLASDPPPVGFDLPLRVSEARGSHEVERQTGDASGAAALVIPLAFRVDDLATTHAPGARWVVSANPDRIVLGDVVLTCGQAGR